MSFRLLPVVLLTVLLLAACGQPAPTVSTTAAPAAAAPTTAPAQATALPPATARPTAAPAPSEPTATTPLPPPAGGGSEGGAPTTPPTDAPQPPSPQPTAQAQPAQTAMPVGAGSELLFLRKGALMALDLATRQQRRIADGVRDFAATPDGATIALVRGEGRAAEIWTVRRDGTLLTQITRNDRAEATPVWAPDGGALAFASAATDLQLAPEWKSWSQWCAASEVHLLDLADNAQVSLGAGCDPAFSPDGRRIAYATPPTTPEPDIPTDAPLIVNSIRLVNRKGQNGWNFASAGGANAPASNAGRVVYAPAFSPDGAQIVYQRFLGYQALVDLDLSEIGGSFEGKGKPLGAGAGWLLPARFAPDGRTLAITENNYSDARGLSAYDTWSVSLIRLEGSREIALPFGTITAVGQPIDELPRGQSATWSPDGTALAVELPPGWRADLPPNQPTGADERPGEVWRWRPGQAPQERLIDDVDFASPLAWLP